MGKIESKVVGRGSEDAHHLRPGAFSAYRYIALQNDEKGNGPLKQYFIGETMHGSNAGILSVS